jgi:uncharacterized protein
MPKTGILQFKETSKHPVGIGLKSQHYGKILDEKPPVSFFEIHAENYMTDGGTHHRMLSEIARDYPLSVHGVGLSLGSAEGIDDDHLERLAKVVERYKPLLLSEHLAWSVSGGTFLNDLLPIPYTQESLDIVTANVSKTQDRIGRQILIENPSSYMAFNSSNMQELDFLISLTKKSGCGLLVDVNNIYVSGCNNGWSAEGYINAIPAELVGEIHLAGHSERNIEGTILRIDDHASPVCNEVWSLYAKLVARIGMRPTLVEWDNAIPSLDIWVGQAKRAQEIAEYALCNAEVCSDG